MRHVLNPPVLRDECWLALCPHIYISPTALISAEILLCTLLPIRYKTSQVEICTEKGTRHNMQL